MLWILAFASSVAHAMPIADLGCQSADRAFSFKIEIDGYSLNLRGPVIPMTAHGKRVRARVDQYFNDDETLNMRLTLSPNVVLTIKATGASTLRGTAVERIYLDETASKVNDSTSIVCTVDPS